MLGLDKAYRCTKVDHCSFGNNVQSTLDFVEATFDFVAFDKVASTWLLV